MIGTRSATTTAAWLAPACTAVLVALVARTGYDLEAGSRAGAEPAVAAVVLALPFATLVLLQVGCAIGVGISDSGAKRAAWLTVATVGAAALLVAVATLDGTPGHRHEVVVAALLLPPIAVAWAAAVRRG